MHDWTFERETGTSQTDVARWFIVHQSTTICLVKLHNLIISVGALPRPGHCFITTTLLDRHIKHDQLRDHFRTVKITTANMLGRDGRWRTKMPPTLHWPVLQPQHLRTGCSLHTDANLSSWSSTVGLSSLMNLDTELHMTDNASTGNFMTLMSTMTIWQCASICSKTDTSIYWTRGDRHLGLAFIFPQLQSYRGIVQIWPWPCRTSGGTFPWQLLHSCVTLCINVSVLVQTIMVVIQGIDYSSL